MRAFDSKQRQKQLKIKSRTEMKPETLMLARTHHAMGMEASVTMPDPELVAKI